jgi:hypothetical protein
MVTELPKYNVTKIVKIRDCGLNEYWLQQQISDDPSILGLGELEVLSVERIQSSGGKLDLLLKNPETDQMYEVEVMLGETNESHIIRTIEYWDNEKRKWPQRQHIAVLVAENITRRFFNVIQLFSQSIPLVAIQANILEAEGRKFLNFTKILDAYEEIDDREPEPANYNEEFWLEKAKWTVDAAKTLLEISKAKFKDSGIGYVKNYISINTGDTNRFWFHKRSEDKSLFKMWFENEDEEIIKTVLDQSNISYATRSNYVQIRLNAAMIKQNRTVFEKFVDIVNRY